MIAHCFIQGVILVSASCCCFSIGATNFVSQYQSLITETECRECGLDCSYLKSHFKVNLR